MRFLAGVSDWSGCPTWPPFKAWLGLLPAPPHPLSPHLPAVFTTQEARRASELGNSQPSPSHCRQLSIISPAAPRAATLCACQGPAFYSLAVTQGRRASQPPFTRGGGGEQSEPRTEEGNRAQMGRPELGAGPRAQGRPWSGCLSSHPLVPRPLSPQPSWALCRGGQLPSLATAFYSRSLRGCRGLATGASAVPAGVFQVVLLLRSLSPGLQGPLLPHARPKASTGHSPISHCTPGSHLLAAGPGLLWLRRAGRMLADARPLPLE